MKLSNKKKIKELYEDCERKHKFIEDIRKHANKHLGKAKNDLRIAKKEFENNGRDWAIIKADYSIFHAGNYLLLKNKGFFCKNHPCLLIALKHHKLISGEFYKKLVKIHKRLSDFGFDLTFQLKELGQYDFYEWKRITKEDVKLGIRTAEIFIQFAENA